MTKSERWILSEWRVACDRVIRSSDKLLAHRERTPYAEVDLLFQSSSREFCGLTLIEVKSWRGDLWAGSFVSKKQAERLYRARLYLESRYQRPARLLLGVVKEENGVIHYFDDLTRY